MTPPWSPPLRPDRGEPLDHRSHRALEEGLLQLHLLERLGSDDQLRQSLLDGVLRRPDGEAERDEENGSRRDRGDDHFGWHLHYTLISTMRRISR